MAKANQLAVPQTYAALRRSVEETLLTGQRLIEQAKVRTYHETGRLIREHLHLHAAESNYGTQTMQRLAADLKISDTVLYRCIRFVDCFPTLATWPKLTWAHYRVLTPVADAKLRRSLATEANRDEWPVIKLEQRICELGLRGEANEVVSTPSKPQELLKPNRGTPGLHLIVDRGEGLAVDLGFKLYWPLTPAQAQKFSKGDIVRIASDDSLRRVDDATKADLFTYAATLRRVVDGDTLVVALEVSPEVFLEQKLRLRGLDCPEMSTPEGRAAKRFIEALFADATAIIINTTKPDKYDRYLADVFIGQPGAKSLEPRDSDSQLSSLGSQLSSGEVYLNNALLENGHAVRKDAADFETNWGLK